MHPLPVRIAHLVRLSVLLAVIRTNFNSGHSSLFKFVLLLLLP